MVWRQYANTIEENSNFSVIQTTSFYQQEHAGSKASVCNRSYSVIAVKRLVYERRLNLPTGLLCVKIQSLFYHVSVGSSDIYRRSHCYSPTDWHH